MCTYYRHIKREIMQETMQNGNETSDGQWRSVNTPVIIHTIHARTEYRIPNLILYTRWIYCGVPPWNKNYNFVPLELEFINDFCFRFSWSCLLLRHYLRNARILFPSISYTVSFTPDIHTNTHTQIHLTKPATYISYVRSAYGFSVPERFHSFAFVFIDGIHGRILLLQSEIDIPYTVPYTLHEHRHKNKIWNNKEFILRFCVTHSYTRTHTQTHSLCLC